MSQRLVSIIMPAYNAAATIDRAIDSVRQQAYPHWELLVIDDASVDGTAERVQSLQEQDNRIQLLKLAHNSGSPSLPRNTGIHQARGSLIAFLDADDIWRSDKLSQQLAAMHRTGAALSCTGYRVINNKGQLLGERKPTASIDYTGLLRQNSIGCSTAIYDAGRLGKRFFPHLGHEDYALWLSILREGHRAAGISDSLTDYYKRPGSISANKVKMLGYFWHIYRHQEQFSTPKSLLYTLRYAWHARHNQRLATDESSPSL